jgi:hypothetical protein
VLLSATHGLFGLDCWSDFNGELEPASLRSNNLSELRAAATRLLRGGVYRHMVLFRWDASEADWVELEELTPEDLPDKLGPPAS